MNGTEHTEPMKIKNLQTKLMALPVWAKLLISPLFILAFLLVMPPLLVGSVMIDIYDDLVSGRMFGRD